MNDKMKPALIGGVVLGLLSAIPFVNMVTCAAARGPSVGGVLPPTCTSRTPPPGLDRRRGAQVGAIAGVVGAVIYLVLGIPLGIMAGRR